MKSTMSSPLPPLPSQEPLPPARAPLHATRSALRDADAPGGPAGASRRRWLALSAGWLMAACGGGRQVAVLPGGGGTGDIPPPPPGAPTPAPAQNPSGGSLPSAGGAFGELTAVSPAQLVGMSWPLAASANVLIDDVEERSLQLGMVARAMGGLDAGGTSGLASDMLVRPALRGAVLSVDAQGFVVEGVRVSWSAQTVWAGSLSGASLRVGDVVQVHGHVNPSAASSAQLQATRVLRCTQRLDFGLSFGLLRAGVAAVPGIYQLNGLAYGTAGAVFASGQSVSPRDGALVHVSFERGSDGGRSVSQVAPVLPTLLADSAVRIQGFVYADGVSADLRIADVPLDLPVSVSASSVQGRLVIAAGLYRQGRLQVSAVA